MHKEYETSGKTFCSPKCPCNWAIHFNSSDDESYDMAGAHNYQHCSSNVDGYEIDPDHVTLFSQLEEKYFCAGLCTNPGHFVFSNVNNGIPDATCQSALALEMTEPIKTLVLTNLIGMLLTTISLGLIMLGIGIKLFKCAGKPCKKFRAYKKRQKQFKQAEMNALEMTEDSEEAYEKVKPQSARSVPPSAPPKK
jgi:hypothetical protein